jgi:hypothetical protein
VQVRKALENMYKKNVFSFSVLKALTLENMCKTLHLYLKVRQEELEANLQKVMNEGATLVMWAAEFDQIVCLRALLQVMCHTVCCRKMCVSEQH